MAKGFSLFDMLGIGDNSGKDSPLNDSSIKELKKKLQELFDVIDENNDALVEAKKVRAELIKEELKGVDVTKQLTAINSKIGDTQNALLELNQERINLIKEEAAAMGVSSRALNSAINAHDGLTDSVEGGGKAAKSSKAAMEGFTKALGSSFSDIVKLLEFDIAYAAELAARQLVELNDKLIKFARSTSGTVNARTLGFDQYGNNRSTLGGSLETISATNGLTSDEFLASLQAFNDGQIIGAANLQNSQRALQEYGITAGRISKLYGVQNSDLIEISKTLTQQYGKSIEDTTSILEHGAEVAASANINVGKFFNNLKEIANLQGSLFIRGGAEGLEKSAYALTKLGLKASELEKISSSYDTFTTLVDKQQSAVALGLNGLAAVQARVFAKVQTGDSAGAANLLQFAGAQDINRLGYRDANGQITKPGLESLKTAGFDQSQVQSIQRLLTMSDKTGISLERLNDETKLSAVELSKKRKIEQQELTISEKFGKLYQQIKAQFIDPLAALLGPALDVVINSLSATFSVLSVVLKPVAYLFQVVGGALEIVADHIRDFSAGIENLLKKLGLMSDESGLTDGLNNIGKVLSKILAVVAGIATVILGQKALSSLGGLASKAGAGLSGFTGSSLGLGRLGSGLAGAAGRMGNVAGPAAIAGLAGSAIGGLVGMGAEQGSDRQKTGSAIGQAASWGATGALIGSVIPGLGTAVGGALGAVAGAIDGWTDGEWFSSYWDNFGKTLSDNDKEKQQQLKISSISGGGVDTSKLGDIMATKRIDNNYAAQSERENANARKQVAGNQSIINVHTSLFGPSAKTRISGN